MALGLVMRTVGLREKQCHTDHGKGGKPRS